MLNWRRDLGYEQRMLQCKQRRIQHEQRMKQLESEIEQIEKETEQLRRENTRAKPFSVLIRQHCFPDESNSTHSHQPSPVPVLPGAAGSAVDG